MKLRILAYRNMRRNSRRTILSITAIAISAVCFVFLFSLIGGLKADMRHNLTTYYNGEVRIRHSLYDKYEQLHPLFLGVKDGDKALAAMEELLPEADFSPRISFPSQIEREGDNVASLGQGVDFEKEGIFQNIDELIIAGRLPAMGKDEVLLTPGLYNDTGVELGDDLSFWTQTGGRSTNLFTMKVVGVVKYPVTGLNKRLFLAPLDRIQYFLRMGNSVTEILVRNLENDGIDAARNLNALFAEGKWEDLRATSWVDIPGMYSWISMAEGIYNIMALVFFLLGATVIINTTMMVIFERTKEIGTIAAMGMTGSEIVRLFFLEALFIALIGSLLGTLLGSALTYPASIFGIDFTEAMGEISFEANPIFYPVLSLGTGVKVFLFSTAVAALSSFFPSRRAARINPVQALRNE